MRWSNFISILAFIVLLVIPVTANAVEFEISDVQIDVYLKENGHVDVVEKHTYDFDGKFNGISREISPKKGSSIDRFEAYENGKLLKVEKKGQLYKVYRSGKNETVRFELHYQIGNGVEKYEDGAQFYWPFFDKRNETDYGKLKISVHPPAKAMDVDYLGYDAAYGKGVLEADGVVVFDFGKVPDSTNGDIRVIYEPSLFSSINAEKGTIRDALKADKEKIEEDRTAFLTAQKSMGKVGSYSIIAFVAFLFGLLVYMVMKRKDNREMVHSLMEDGFIPKETLSMPATIYYTHPSGLGPEVMSASLLDLIRKGYVKQVTDESFGLLHTSGVNNHEAALIDLLFNEVGDGEQFTLEDLKTYTKDEENHESYSNTLHTWKTAILQEVKDAQLYEEKIGLRWSAGLLSIALIPVIVQLGRYEVYLSMAILIGLALVGLCIAFFYKPRNLKGLQIKEEWKRFRKHFEQVSAEEWERLPVDDKYRAYIYGIGVKDGKLEKLYNEFERAEQRSDRKNDHYYAAYNPMFMTQTFATANNDASPSSSGSSTSISSGGGGVGGGGGGSGAF